MRQSNQVSAGACHEGQSSRPTKHRVLPGETLEGIADRYGLLTLELRQANDLWTRSLVTDKILTIPVPESPQNPAAKS